MTRSDSNPQNSQKIRRRSVRQMLDRLIRGSAEPTGSRRGRLLLESLEKRQMLAGDSDLLFTDGADAASTTVPSQETSDALPVEGQSEGESEADLVQFAIDLTAAGVQLFGAAFFADSTAQRDLFEDGRDNLPFVEVTNPDQTLSPRILRYFRHGGFQTVPK